MLDDDFLKCREDKDYNKLIRVTQREWKKLVYVLTRRHKLPPSADENDVLQVVLMACIEFVDRWDPQRGMPIGIYVRSRCVDKALKYIFQARRCVGPGGKLRGGPARHEICFSSLKTNSHKNNDEDSEVSIDDIAQPVQPIQDSITLANEIIEGSGIFSPLFSTFIKTGNLEEATKEAMRHQGIREKWHLTNINSAKRTVQRKIENIVYK